MAREERRIDVARAVERKHKKLPTSYQSNANRNGGEGLFCETDSCNRAWENGGQLHPVPMEVRRRGRRRKVYPAKPCGCSVTPLQAQAGHFAPDAAYQHRQEWCWVMRPLM